MNNQNDHDTYIIPPNFVDTGTFFGGMFRARNVIEAGILAAVTGLPVFLLLPFGLTARIIVLCLTTLPLVLFALIGISGESLSSFLVIFLKYMKNRHISHVYDHELPDWCLLDYDNLQQKQILDTIALYVMADDSGLLCDAYNTTELGDKDGTRIYIMEKGRFAGWLSGREKELKSISDF